MKRWTEQEAISRLCEVIEQASIHGPQIITLDGVVRAVLLSIEEHHALTARQPTLKDYLLGGPKFDDFAIERDRNTGHEIPL
jgi:hypothetical protein